MWEDPRIIVDEEGIIVRSDFSSSDLRAFKAVFNQLEHAGLDERKRKTIAAIIARQASFNRPKTMSTKNMATRLLADYRAISHSDVSVGLEILYLLETKIVNYDSGRKLAELLAYLFNKFKAPSDGRLTEIMSQEDLPHSIHRLPIAYKYLYAIVNMITRLNKLRWTFGYSTPPYLDDDLRLAFDEFEGLAGATHPYEVVITPKGQKVDVTTIYSGILYAKKYKIGWPMVRSFFISCGIDVFVDFSDLSERGYVSEEIIKACADDPDIVKSRSMSDFTELIDGWRNLKRFNWVNSFAAYAKLAEAGELPAEADIFEDDPSSEGRDFPYCVLERAEKISVDSTDIQLLLGELNDFSVAETVPEESEEPKINIRLGYRNGKLRLVAEDGKSPSGPGADCGGDSGSSGNSVYKSAENNDDPIIRLLVRLKELLELREAGGDSVSIAAEIESVHEQIEALDRARQDSGASDEPNPDERVESRPAETSQDVPETESGSTESERPDSSEEPESPDDSVATDEPQGSVPSVESETPAEPPTVGAPQTKEPKARAAGKPAPDPEEEERLRREASLDAGLIHRNLDIKDCLPYGLELEPVQIVLIQGLLRPGTSGYVGKRTIIEADLWRACRANFRAIGRLKNTYEATIKILRKLGIINQENPRKGSPTYSFSQSEPDREAAAELWRRARDFKHRLQVQK